MQQVQIAVVGGGIVGSAMAALLSQNGFSIAFIEQHKPSAWSAQHFALRVCAFNLASEAILASLGLWSACKALRVSPIEAMQVWDDEGEGFLEFDAQLLQLPNLGHIVENNLITQVTWDYLSKQGNVQCFLNQPVIALSAPQFATDGHSWRQLTLADQTEIKCQLVIAADGRESPLRQMAMLTTQAYATGHHAVIATVRHSKAHDQIARQTFLPTGPLAFLPLTISPIGHYSSIVWSTYPAHATQLQTITEKEFCQQLQQAFGDRLGEIISSSDRAYFPLIHRHAPRYVDTSFALIGDAAHSIHPLAGQGANLGLMDAAVLAEELALAAQRNAPLGHSQLLTHYARRRHFDNAVMLNLMDTLRLTFANQQPLLKLFRNLGMKKINQFKPIKRWLIQQAIGQRLDLTQQIQWQLEQI